MWKSFYDQLRGTLGGLDSFDFTEQSIATWGLEDEIRADLFGWYPNFSDVQLESESDHKAIRLRVYIRYFAAAICMRVGFGFIKKSWTDGQGEWQRFEGDWQKAAQDFADKAAAMKTAIMDDLNLSPTNASLRPTMMGSASPSRDPVTTPRSVS